MYGGTATAALGSTAAMVAWPARSWLPVPPGIDGDGPVVVGDRSSATGLTRHPACGDR